MTGLQRMLAAALLAATGTGSVAANDWQYGAGAGLSISDDAGLLRLGVGQRFAAVKPLDASWPLQPRWEAVADIWSPISGADGDTVAAAGLRGALATPVPGSGHAYAELGTGVLVLGDEELTDAQDMGSNLQFDSHLGIGLHLDDARSWSVAYEFHHASNAGTGDPNPGINFHLLILRYRP